MVPPSDLPFLLTHGLQVFWAGFGVTTLAGGALFARRSARRRARAAAAEAAQMLGAPERDAAQAAKPDEVVTLEGVLVADVSLDAGERAPPDAVTLQREGETVVLGGDVQILAGTRDVYRLSAARTRRLRAGDRVTCRGEVQAIEADGNEGGDYRAAKGRRIVVGPAEEGRPIPIASAEPARARLDLFGHVVFAGLAAALYLGATWGAGRFAGERAWSAAWQEPPSVARIDAAMRWGSIGAATPFHRRWCLDAIEGSLLISVVDDPNTQVDYALRAAQYDRWRTGSCRAVVQQLELRNGDEALGAAGEYCGDAPGLRAAARAHLRHAEIEEASRDVERAAVEERPAPGTKALRTREQLFAEQRVQLLAGKVGPAAAVLREIADRVDEVYEPSSQLPNLRIELRCAADALDARAVPGSDAARQRLGAVVWDHAQAADVRATCGLLLADTLEGAARLEIIDRLKGDPAVPTWAQLRNLEIEADPARALAPRWSGLVALPDSTLSIVFVTTDSTEWRALRALARIPEPTTAQRLSRMTLAGSLVPVAAQLGADAEAHEWYAMLVRDLERLPAGTVEWSPRDRERVAAIGAFLALRDGETPAPFTGVVGDADLRREVDGLVQYRATGDLAALRAPAASYKTFLAPSSGKNDILTGLEVVATGSSDQLAQWLANQYSPTALDTILVAAPRLQSERAQVLAWVDSSRATRLSVSLLEQVVVSAARANIADNLQAPDVAKRHAAEALRLRTALFRRETALVIELTKAAR